MPSPLRTHAEQNELLLEIQKLARAYARGRVRADEIEDFAGDITLYCLEKLRAKEWERPENLQAYIRQLVKARVADARRKNAIVPTSSESDLPPDGPDAIMVSSPDVEWTAEDIREFQQTVMRKMSPRVRQAYSLVRLSDASYEDAALQMNVSVKALHKYIVRAHRLFRVELERIGISAPSAGNASRARNAWRRPASESSSPDREMIRADCNSGRPVDESAQPDRDVARPTLHAA